MALSLLPRELAAQLALLPRDPGTGRLGLPGSLAALFPEPARGTQRDIAGPLVAYRLLAALALSGWSYRRALVHALLTGWPRPRTCATHTPYENGTLKRAYRELAQVGLWQEEPVYLNGRAYVMVRVTAEGRMRLADAGIACVEAEWERMEQRHNGHGENQVRHTAACSALAYHARRLGYRTQLLPEVEGQAQPDLLLARVSDERRFYVEAQRRGGDAGKRRMKWINLARLAGLPAICAERPSDARRFAEEARLARVPHGYVTDLLSLQRAEAAELVGPHDAMACDLWTATWRGSGPLQPYRMGADEN